MILLTDYKKAVKDLQALNKKETISTTTTKELIQAIKIEYRNKIHALESEMGHTIAAHEEHLRHNLHIINTAKELPKAITTHVEVLLQLMDINLEKIPNEVYYYSDRDLAGNYINPKRKVVVAPYKTLLDNDYATINLYIVPNKKPLNKYSLIIRGYHVFGELITGYDRGYVQGINESKCNLRLTLKDAPYEEDLHVYADKNLSKIMKGLGCVERIEILGKQYLQAKELLKDKEWQILYLESRKNYYENCYSKGTETPEYAKICEELKRLQSK